LDKHPIEYGALHPHEKEGKQQQMQVLPQLYSKS
jgi:hypothetical protein